MQAGSHHGKGWETFTDEVLRVVDRKEQRVVFVLWGAPARKKQALVHGPQHVVIESAHPSPLSAHNGFFGSRPFSRTNAALVEAGLAPIDWRLPRLIAVDSYLWQSGAVEPPRTAKVAARDVGRRGQLPAGLGNDGGSSPGGGVS